jgi:hypothetical protein
LRSYNHIIYLKIY